MHTQTHTSKRQQLTTTEQVQQQQRQQLTLYNFSGGTFVSQCSATLEPFSAYLCITKCASTSDCAPVGVTRSRAEHIWCGGSCETKDRENGFRKWQIYCFATRHGTTSLTLYTKDVCLLGYLHLVLWSMCVGVGFVVFVRLKWESYKLHGTNACNTYTVLSNTDENGCANAQADTGNACVWCVSLRAALRCIKPELCWHNNLNDPTRSNAPKSTLFKSPHPECRGSSHFSTSVGSAGSRACRLRSGAWCLQRSASALRQLLLCHERAPTTDAFVHNIFIHKYLTVYI